MKRYKCGKITRKNCLRTIKGGLSFVLCMSGLILILGLAGACDNDVMISLGQIVIHCISAIGLILSGMVIDCI